MRLLAIPFQPRQRALKRSHLIVALLVASVGYRLIHTHRHRPAPVMPMRESAD